MYTWFIINFEGDVRECRKTVKLIFADFVYGYLHHARTN
jgi:hypothetical protein